MNDTLGSIIDRTGVDVFDYLDREDLVPTITGQMQVQGDLAIIPVRPSAKPGAPVPAEGVPVIRGEVGGHTHLLIGECLSWAPVEGRSQSLGVVTVPDEAVGYLAHPEHGYVAFGPGAYEIRRQREMADEIRMVRD